MDEKEFIESLKPIENTITEKIGRDRAVLYVVVILKDNDIEALFPEIAVASCKLFPLFFSLKGNFDEYPDGRKVRDAIWHLVDKNKAWLIGNQQSGYKPSQIGIEIYQKEVLSALSGKHLSTKTYSTGSDKQEYFLQHCINTDAFRKFLEGEKDEIENYEIIYLLKSTRDTPKNIIKNKLDKLISYYNSRKYEDIKTAKGGKVILSQEEWKLFGDMLKYIKNNLSKFIGDQK